MQNVYTTNERILIVDDDPDLIAIIKSYLEDIGFTVYEAASGKAGLDLYRQKSFDLILSDLNMPKMSGIQLLETLKNEGSQTPFILMSGAGDMNDVIEALRLGAWDFIVKPFNKEVLEHSVCRSLAQLRLINENKQHRQDLELKNTQLQENLNQLEEDQKAGKNVQQQLLPQSEIKFKDYALSHTILPSLYLSGDFVDYFAINPDQIVFYIADVSGHGSSSAFVTVLLKSIIEQMTLNYRTRQEDTILYPEKVLKLVSDEIFTAKLGKYLTMIYCVLNLKENTLDYSIGGHYPKPIIWDEKKAQFLNGEGIAIGIMEHSPFKNYHHRLPAQFALLMLSDGIFEILKGQNLDENEKTLLSLVNSSTLTINDILYKLRVSKEQHFPDDITFLLMTKH